MQAVELLEISSQKSLVGPSSQSGPLEEFRIIWKFQLLRDVLQTKEPVILFATMLVQAEASGFFFLKETHKDYGLAVYLIKRKILYPYSIMGRV